jgi:hypothetical protein
VGLQSIAYGSARISNPSHAVAPIARVLVQDSMDRVFSLSTDLELKVQTHVPDGNAYFMFVHGQIWDILDTSCLATVSRRKHAIHIEPSCKDA